MVRALMRWFLAGATVLCLVAGVIVLGTLVYGYVAVEANHVRRKLELPACFHGCARACENLCWGWDSPFAKNAVRNSACEWDRGGCYAHCFYEQCRVGCSKYCDDRKDTSAVVSSTLFGDESSNCPEPRGDEGR
jgi:hypothetical protein